MIPRVLIFLILIVFTACKPRNNLNADEQKLMDEINAEEQENQDASSANSWDTGMDEDTLLYNIRYEPERKVDPQNSPELIDIAGNIEHIKEFKLSDIVQSIRYIRLQQTNDSAFWGKLNNDIPLPGGQKEPLKEEIPLKIIKNKDYIVAYNDLGMLLYNSNGELLKTICSNEFTNMALSKTGSSVMSGYTFKGANGPPRLVGNKLYYNYEDNVNKIDRMMELECNNLPLLLPADIENPNQISGLGQPVASTGERSYSATALNPNSFIKSGHPRLDNDMITIFNNNGDTLCSFPGTQKIVNYTSTLSRTPDWGSSFTFNGEYYFREPQSDTIFKVTPPNQLIPSFIINLGEYKVEKIQQAMDPSFDLSDKILIQSISVSENFVFIHYTKGYNSPHNQREKLVKFFYTIYDRRTKELWHVKSDPDDSDFALENDLDGGLPVWPGKFSYRYYVPCSVSEDGEIIQSMKGEVLKEYINTDEFLNSSAPEEDKQKFKELANTVGKYETILVVMK